MATHSISRGEGSQRKNDSSRRRETERFEQRLGEILEHATAVFYERGYEGASMRDLSRASGMSLAGLYYYFESKERLLYLIQKHTFDIGAAIGARAFGKHLRSGTTGAQLHPQPHRVFSQESQGDDGHVA